VSFPANVTTAYCVVLATNSSTHGSPARWGNKALCLRVSKYRILWPPAEQLADKITPHWTSPRHPPTCTQELDISAFTPDRQACSSTSFFLHNTRQTSYPVSPAARGISPSLQRRSRNSSVASSPRAIFAAPTRPRPVTKMPISIEELDALAREFFEGRGEQVCSVLAECCLILQNG
jgi:hypothetical protein